MRQCAPHKLTGHGYKLRITLDFHAGNDVTVASYKEWEEELQAVQWRKEIEVQNKWRLPKTEIYLFASH